MLLADDNVVNQRLAVYMLTSLGCRVDVASDGAEAVRLASERSFRPSLPIFALTAAATQDDVARARAAGMDELLQNPIEVEGIRASLARVALASPSPPPSSSSSSSPSRSAAVAL